MSIYQFNGPRLRCASQLRRRVAYVNRLLTKASTQLCDLKITLAHQVLIAGVELLLHLPVTFHGVVLFTAVGRPSNEPHPYVPARRLLSRQ